MKQQANRSVVLFGLSASVIAAVAIAGDLAPPSGPVQATGPFTINPQTATFPITINQSGSYRVLGDLTLTAGTNGFLIDADDVTLDLGGFTLDGGSVGFEGIFVSVRDNVTIRNGTVKDFLSGGIFATNGTHVVIADVRSSGNGIEGIAVGADGVIRECVASENLWGIRAGTGSYVVDCLVDANSDIGIYAVDDVTISDCVVTAIAGGGISVGGDCHVLRNSVNWRAAGSSTTPGILQRNVGVGRSIIDSNRVIGFAPGIRVDPGIMLGEVIIVRNVVLGAGGLFGYETNSNFAGFGLSGNPDTADAWDNLGHVTVVR